MDVRPVVWDAANRKHLGEDHPERSISIQEIDEALRDPRRVEVHLAERDAYQVVGANDCRQMVGPDLDRSG